MSKIKDFLGQEALDARELVDEGLMTEDEWQKRYTPQPGSADYEQAMQEFGIWSATNLLENFGYKVIAPSDDHDCHAEGGESGCDHPAHGEDIV